MDNEIRTVRFIGHFGDRLRLARQRKGLSQRELARRSGVGHDTVSRLEKAPKPEGSIDHLLRLQGALDLCSIEQLLGGFEVFPSQQLALELNEELAPPGLSVMN